jgi:DMSO/TMAO reductase YedYZ molybdopterin-dependent catalytic subunit
MMKKEKRMLWIMAGVSVVLLFFVLPAQVAAVEVIFDGSVAVVEGNFTWYDSDSNPHEVANFTPHGALEAASIADGFDYGGGWHGGKSTALIDWITDDYVYDGDVGWNYQLNGIYQNYFSDTTGVSNLAISDGDYIEFYFGPKDDQTTENATAVVQITVNQAPTLDIIWDSSVILENGTFNWTDSDSNVHEVNWLTPHGALEAASVADSFDYGGGWNGGKNTALIDWIAEYEYDSSVTPKLTWNYQLNGVYQNYFSDTTGISNNPITNGDYLEFYYGPDQETTENATAAVWITVNPAPGDWDLDLVGATNKRVTKADFEEGVDCGHYANWTDSETGEFWEGIPLWYLVGMVDDDESGGQQWTFNDALAAEGYSINVIANDGWSTSLDSSDIARNDGYIVANKLNGSELPEQTPGGKPCWPLHLKGPEVSGGQQVGSIATIELVGLPELSEGWELSLLGDVGDIVTQTEFEEAATCHGVQYVDGGDVWEGIPLWYLCGAVDDLEPSSHWTFNDTRATSSYTVTVIAGDGYNRSFASNDIARNNSYIVANTLNGEPLDYVFPLKLVGSAITSGKDKVGNISEIVLVELQTPEPAPGSYNLNLSGKITDVISQSEVEAAVACYGTTWIDDDQNEWQGIPLWYLCGWVDDRIPHGPDAFNANAATAGYTIIVKASDGYAKDFASADVAWSTDYIIANTMNGEPLNDSFPLRIVGPGAPGGKSVGQIAEIELTDFSAPSGLMALHIIKYGADGTTIVNETNVSYLWMEQNLDVYGNGETYYKFEGIDFTEGDHWDQNETYPGGFKISDAIKGSSVKDLCELVGGVGPGTDIKLVAIDGYETTLGYENIYAEELTTEQQERQGEAVLAWYTGDNGYVPDYTEGMRLFFTPDDYIFGLWDMHECMGEKYWHYYWNEDIQYPSCAGLSAKWIITIKIYAQPEADWNLTLEGAITDTISKSYFEQAIACAMGGHAAEYTDSKGRTWEGLPLWYLCGWVDDDNSHSEGAYNDALAAAGYVITIFASDGYTATINSRETIRNSNYIVANTLDGSHIAEDDDSWPLRLVGVDATGGLQVKGIAKILLEFPEVSPTPTPTSPSRVGGGGTARDSDNDGYSDIQEMLTGTDPNDPCDPNPESRACLATRSPTPAAVTTSTATTTPTATATPTVPPPVATPTPTATATPTTTAKKPLIPGFEAISAVLGLLAIAYLVLRQNKE